MTEEKRKIIEEDVIIRDIKFAREEDVPEGFAASVMAAIEPRKISAWTRLRLWLVRPQVMTFKPLQVIPAMTLVVALAVLAVFKMDGPVQDDAIRLSTVRFIMNDSSMQATTVSVIGSFNEWKADRSVMWYNEDEKAWILEAQLPPGDHAYLFLVDGEQLVPDPQAHMTRDDGFGNKNSILFVNGDNEQAL